MTTLAPRIYLRREPDRQGRMDQTLEALVERWLGADALRASVTPLEGGLTNRNYRIDLDSGRFVMRVTDPASALLGIDRQREYACATIAAQAGVGPEVVAYLPDEGVLVSRFVDGDVLTPETARRPDVLARVVAAIRRLHAGPAFPGVFSPFRTVREYLGLARDRGVAIPEDWNHAVRHLDHLERSSGDAVSVPCHNDLLAANLVDTGERVVILDWEYAAMGDPAFDLANFAANQGFDADGCAHFLREHGAGEFTRVEALRVASDLREAAWGYLQSAVSVLDFDFLGYGRRHLDRALGRSGT